MNEDFTISFHISTKNTIKYAALNDTEWIPKRYQENVKIPNGEAK